MVRSSNLLFCRLQKANRAGGPPYEPSSDIQRTEAVSLRFKEVKLRTGRSCDSAQNKSWFQKALGYFYFKVEGEGFGVKDLKIGPAKADIGVRWNGKDFRQTTDGMKVTTVNSEAGAKVELGPIKLGVQRTLGFAELESR